MHDVLDRWTVVVITTRVNSVRRSLCTRWARIDPGRGATFKVQAKGKALRERDAIAAECCVRQYYIDKVSQNKESE
jgi:hypothetical protein